MATQTARSNNPTRTTTLTARMCGEARVLEVVHFDARDAAHGEATVATTTEAPPPSLELSPEWGHGEVYRR